MAKPRALVTNDDGIESLFLKALLDALEEHFELSVVAPENEKSWAGKSMSRTQPVSVSEYKGYSCPAWAVAGTPADCVNLALGNLLPEKPDIVISGINIGFNATISVIMSSGTIAAALEGAGWGLPALASSLQVPKDIKPNPRKNKGLLPSDHQPVLAIAARLTARHALEALDQPVKPFTVHNLNFPFSVTEDTPMEKTVPAPYQTGSLFEKTGENLYGFRYGQGNLLDNNSNTDWDCIKRGHISYSKLDFTKLTQL